MSLLGFGTVDCLVWSLLFDNKNVGTFPTPSACCHVQGRACLCWRIAWLHCRHSPDSPPLPRWSLSTCTPSCFPRAFYAVFLCQPGISVSAFVINMITVRIPIEAPTHVFTPHEVSCVVLASTGPQFLLGKSSISRMLAFRLRRVETVAGVLVCVTP